MRAAFDVERLDGKAVEELAVFNWPGLDQKAEPFTQTALAGELLMVYVKNGAAQLSAADEDDRAVSEGELVMISDGEVLDAELDLIFRILDALHIPHGPLQKRMEDWQQNPPEEDGILANLDRYLPYLDRKARAILLEASYHMAVVDRFFHENELQFLKKIAAKLDILPGEFEIIIDLAQEEEVFFTSLLDHFDAIEKQSREHAARAFFPEPT